MTKKELRTLVEQKLAERQKEKEILRALITAALGLLDAFQRAALLALPGVKELLAELGIDT